MRILLIGGYYSITATLARQYLRMGHDVSAISSSGPDSWFSLSPQTGLLDEISKRIDEEKFELVEFHLGDSLLGLLEVDRRRVEDFFRLLKSQGAKLSFFSYGIDSAVINEGSKVGLLFKQFIEKYFDRLIIGSVLSASLSSWKVKSSWVSAPVSVVESHEEEIKDGSKQLRVLHIPHNTSGDETRFIINTASEVHGSAFPFSFQVIPPEEISAYESVKNAIKNCDLLIEQLDEPAFGVLALEAMALGKTVISGNSPELAKCWEQLATCPVLGVTRETLRNKLEATLREPRCLRDFGKRSRQYLEKFHKPEVVAELMMQVWKD